MDAIRKPPPIALCTEDDDDILVVDQSTKFYPKFFDNLNEIRRSGALCDVTLKTQGHRLTAHRLVLASAIPYFRAMFTNDMLEANQRDIEIYELEHETLEQMINYAYSGQIRISTGNVQSVTIGANFLQLTDVVEECAKFLQRRLHPHNVLAIRAFSYSLGIRSLLMAADRYLQKYFMIVATGDDFLNLHIDDVCDILSRDELYVDSEQDVFKAGLRWVQHEPSSRQQHASRVLSCIRLPLLKPSFISDEVASHCLFRGDLGCRDLVDEAKDYHLLPDRRPLLKSFRSSPRYCKDVPGLIFAIGGLSRERSSSGISSQSDQHSTVEVFDPLTNRWSNVRSMPSHRSRVGVAVEGRKVYAIGGFDGVDRLRIVEVFDYNRAEWTQVAPLAKKRSALGAAFLNDRLYVCGGYDGVTSLATVEIYSPEKDIWEAGPSMTKQRSAAGVAVLDQYIYVLGGHDGMSIFSSVERFSPEKNKWEAVAPMLSKRCRHGAAAFNGKIYVCGGYDGSQFLNSVECYDPVTNEWKPVTPMNIKRSRVSLVANVNSLYAIAGYDGIANLSSMEVFKAENETWELAPSMVSHEGGVGVGVVPIPPNMLS